MTQFAELQDRVGWRGRAPADADAVREQSAASAGERGAALPEFAPRDAVPVPAARRPIIGFVWDRFGPYHIDRLEACALALGQRYEIVGIEIASFDDTYGWEKSRAAEAFRKVTLFPDRSRPEIGQARCFRRLLAACIRLRVGVLFACNYEDPVIFLVSLALRLLGRPVVVMQDAKFDDKQRRLSLEFLKSALYLPYKAALAGSPRTASYLEFLGFPKSRILIGYDTVSVARIRALADAPPAPAGAPHAERQFTIIARFVQKKNLAMALDAYALYVARALARGGPPRELRICGSGELEAELRARAEALRLDGVRFLGFLQEGGVARELASSLALVLPSVEEQYGLVVNEAVAMGVPVLLSDNCGARDVLVRSGVNGYVFEPDNPEGLALWLDLLDRDPAEWARLARNNAAYAPRGDTVRFADAVDAMLAAIDPRNARTEQRA